MSTTIQEGQPVTLSATFENPPGTLADPTSLFLTVTDPQGVETTYAAGALQHASTGAYSKIVVPTSRGRWTYAFNASGAFVGVAAGVFTVAPEDWTPTVDEVGGLLRSRTINDSMIEVGTFTPAASAAGSRTRPAAEDVARIIEEETGALTGFVGNDLPASLWALAHSAALYRVASRIELEYWPEQIQAGRSNYEQLAAQRDTEEGRLIAAVRETVGLGEAGGVAIGSMLTSSQAARDSAAIFALDQVANGPDLSPQAPVPSGWPALDPWWGGAAGTVI